MYVLLHRLASLPKSERAAPEHTGLRAAVCDSPAGPHARPPGTVCADAPPGAQDRATATPAPKTPSSEPRRESTPENRTCEHRPPRTSRPTSRMSEEGGGAPATTRCFRTRTELVQSAGLTEATAYGKPVRSQNYREHTPAPRLAGWLHVSLLCPYPGSARPHVSVTSPRAGRPLCPPKSSFGLDKSSEAGL